jgi:hypothetical protein
LKKSGELGKTNRVGKSVFKEAGKVIESARGPRMTLMTSGYIDY